MSLLVAFPASDLSLLWRLLLAHVLADFVLQPASWVEDRRNRRLRGAGYWKHLGVVSLLTMLAGLTYSRCGRALGWYPEDVLPLVVLAVAHGVIDIWKDSRKSTSARNFFLDQGAHLLTILVAWTWIRHDLIWTYRTLIGENTTQLWSAVLGIVVVLWPARIVIGKLLDAWNLHPARDAPPSETGPKTNPSIYVGYLERLLILLFIWMGYMEGIGFLFAAKSVFRFADLKDETDRARAEYILIGTLLSFSLAIGVGLLLVQ